MPLSVPFLERQGLRLLGGGVCARRLIRRHLLPDVCACCVSRISSVSVAWKRLIVASRDLPFPFFKVLGFGDTGEIKYRNARLSH